MLLKYTTMYQSLSVTGLKCCQDYLCAFWKVAVSLLTVNLWFPILLCNQDQGKPLLGFFGGDPAGLWSGVNSEQIYVSASLQGTDDLWWNRKRITAGEIIIES